MTYTRFSPHVVGEVVRRSTREGTIYCEGCGLHAKKFQIDHIIPDALGGKAILSNAQLLCHICYGVKNPEDTTTAAKTKRQSANMVSPQLRPPGARMQSRGFQRYEREPRNPRPALRPKPLFD